MQFWLNLKIFFIIFTIIASVVYIVNFWHLTVAIVQLSASIKHLVATQPLSSFPLVISSSQFDNTGNLPIFDDIAEEDTDLLCTQLNSTGFENPNLIAFDNKVVLVIVGSQSNYSWISIDKLLIYSRAYYDDRLQMVTVLGQIDRYQYNDQILLLCSLYFNINHTISIMTVPVRLLTFYIWYCDYQFDNVTVSVLPDYVSIHKFKTNHSQSVTSNQNRDEDDVIKVGKTERRVLQVSKPYRGKMSKFAVCMAALHTDFEHWELLIQAIELYRLLGAQRFTIYFFSASDVIIKLMRYYQKQGILDLVSVEYNFACYSHYSCQWWRLNDCIRRNMYRFQYLAMTDADEIIYPYHNQSLIDLLDQLSTLTHNDSTTAASAAAGSFDFKTALFVPINNLSVAPHWPAHESGSNLESYLRTNVLSFTNRLKRTKTIEHGDSSKSIVVPHCVEKMWVHYVRKFIDNDRCKELLVDESIAINRHYKIPRDHHWFVVGRDDLKNSNTTFEDWPSAQNVGHLVTNAKSVIKEINKGNF